MDSCVPVVSGMLSYCDRYSESLKHVLKTFGPIPEFSGATAEKVHQVRESCGLSGRELCAPDVCVPLESSVSVFTAPHP